MPSKRAALPSQGATWSEAPKVQVRSAAKADNDLLLPAVRLLAKATKKARTFETQKVVRKLKKLQAEDATSTEVPELEALLNVLKALKPDAIAQHVLHSYFASPAAEADMLEQSRLTAALGDEPVRKIDPEALEGRAWNRVLSGKGMREARTDAVRGIRVRLGLPVAPRPRPTTSKPRIEPTPPPEDEMIVDVESDAPNDGYDTDGEPIVAGPSKRPRSPSLDQVDAPPAKRRESAFLPSLSVGYTLGDSDAEEWSGAEDERRREEKASTRKNRRGQRARQAIWEKKYGSGAKHVAKQREAAFAARQTGRRPNKPQPPSGPQPIGYGVEAPAKPTRHEREKALAARKAKPEHASWAAKRSAVNTGGIVTAPIARKVVFD